MADLSVTAASVIAGSDAAITQGTLGATVTAGQVLYQEDATNLWKLADNNSGTAEAKTPEGIALNGGATGQPVAVLTKGTVTIGATLTAGVAYYLSATAGGICPVADLTSGMNPSFLGIASSTTVLKVNITASGATL